MRLNANQSRMVNVPLSLQAGADEMIEYKRGDIWRTRSRTSEQADFTRRRHPRRGALDREGQRCPPVPVEQARRRSLGPLRQNLVRARLVHGFAADLRPAGA